MNGANAGAATTAAAAAAIANATLASGAVVHMEPYDFQVILGMTERPLVVCALGGWIWKTYKYTTSYRGLIFYTSSKTPLELPKDAEVITANRISVPEM